MDEEDNAFGYFQNNNNDSDRYEDGNSGNDIIIVENLVWENIDDDIVIPDIPDHYCGPRGLKESV